MSTHEAASTGAAGNDGAESIEVERKYEVPEHAVMPRAEAYAALGLTLDAPETHELRATYFDTPDRALARAGIAVRERSGGHDAGWHVKQRLSGGVREVAWPPAPEAPEALIAKLHELLAGNTGEAGAAVAGPVVATLQLEPLAQMRTTRVTTLVRQTGKPVIELADDRVLGIDHTAGGVRRAWREWEAELVLGEDPAVLALVEPLLLAAGAVPSLSFAKIARASGQLVVVAKQRGASPAQISALEALDADDQARARTLEV
ncbi:CYTH domain-containing protein [Leucobacter sp. HY1910]